MKSKFKRIQFGIVYICLVFIISIFSFNVKAAAEPLEEARQKIKDNYVTEVPDSILNRATIKDIINGLNDPYSKYFTKQEEENFKNAIDNKMVGIGVYIQVISDGVKITGFTDPSPAKDAGLQAEDIIIEADGNSLKKVDPSLASSYIRGQAETSVKLVVKRGDTNLTFNVQRKEISLPTVTAEMLNNTAYINIGSFGWDTSQLFTQELQKMRMQSPDRYVIDLRDNGGGYMITALKIAGHFIGENPALVVENRGGEKIGYLAEEKDFIIDKPVIFLINENTASASEILSAAVKDYNKAYFIGKTTYGKGVAQDMYDLSDGSALKLTVEKFYSPTGKIIQKVGITPDFMVDGVDSLAVAELFSGKCKNELDKSGFVKVDMNGQSFEINLDLAKKEKAYWEAFRYVISKASKSDVYIGTTNGWVKAPEDYFDNLYKFLYGKYKVLDTLKNASEDKVFTIKFNKKVDYENVKNILDIELINSNTGERAAFDIKEKDDKSINLVPKEHLKSGESYYVKVKDTIKPVTVK